MSTNSPSNWGTAEPLVSVVVAMPRPTSIEDTLSLLFDAFTVGLTTPEGPDVATSVASFTVPWRRADRPGFASLHVDIRGAADGDGEWHASLLVQVGVHAQAFDLTLQPGNFVFSLDLPLGFTSATDLVLVPICVVLAGQRATGASALASVDSLDIRATVDPTRVRDH